jgi:hypothetical protein
VAYVYAFHRRARLLKTRLLMPFVSSDYVLAAELALAGQLVQYDRRLSTFTLSTTATGTTANFSSWKPIAIQRMLDPTRTGPLDMLITVRRRHFEHLAAVLRSSLSRTDKLLALEAASRPARARLRARL